MDQSWNLEIIYKKIQIYQQLQLIINKNNFRGRLKQSVPSRYYLHPIYISQSFKITLVGPKFGRPIYQTKFCNTLPDVRLHFMEYPCTDRCTEILTMQNWKTASLLFAIPIFDLKCLNQGAALVHVYTDGTVLVSHGGVEMGQGLYTKMIQIVARELNVDVQKVFTADTSTANVPNGSPSAASYSSDLNGFAVKDACQKIKQRYGNEIEISLFWGKLCKMCYFFWTLCYIKGRAEYFWTYTILTGTFIYHFSVNVCKHLSKNNFYTTIDVLELLRLVFQKNVTIKGHFCC